MLNPTKAKGWQNLLPASFLPLKYPQTYFKLKTGKKALSTLIYSHLLLYLRLDWTIMCQKSILYGIFKTYYLSTFVIPCMKFYREAYRRLF